MNLLYHKILVLVKRFFRKITNNEKIMRHRALPRIYRAKKSERSLSHKLGTIYPARVLAGYVCQRIEAHRRINNVFTENTDMAYFIKHI